MTLAFVAFHMRDYQRDTQALTLEGHGAYFLLLQHCWTHGRIPLDDVGRAAICKVTVPRYRKQLAAMVEPYFDENGENKRATVEIAKAEKIRLRQAMAGHRGGTASGERRKLQAMAKPPPSHGEAVAEPRSSHGEAIKNIKQLSSSLDAAREGAVANTAGSVIAVTPAGLAEEAREKVRKSSSIPVTGELQASIQAKRWAP